MIRDSLLQRYCLFLLAFVMVFTIGAGEVNGSAVDRDRPARAEPFATESEGSVSSTGVRYLERTPAAPAASWTVPGDYATIQAAIDAAGAGDIITVASGTYAEALLIDGKDLTIIGAGTGVSYITGTAGQTQYIVRITNGAIVDLSGFTIDGTGIDRQYGIYADAGSDGSIHDCEIVNVSWPGAGGIAVRRQECYIDVIDNDVYGFGRIGIYTRDDVIGNTDTGVISGNTVTGLGAADPARLSYGISVYSGNPTIDNNDVYDCLSGANVSAWASAGLDIWTGATAAITNNNFYNCQVGILSNSASPTMSGNTFTGITDDDVRLDYFVKGNPTPHWAEYYDTIQDAIDAIPVTTYPCIVWIGVYSGGGIYAEALNVNKPCHIWGYSRAGVLLDVEGHAVNGAGVYISAADVLISGFTLEGNNAVSTPRYGVKFGAFDGCYLDDAEIRNVYRSGMDALGATNLSVSAVEAKDNGGNGLQLCDCSDVTFQDITTSNNSWGGVAMFTWGQYSPIGVTGVVFTGTNSFGETGSDVGSIYLEEGNFADPANPHPISFSTDILDGADVTVQLADVTHTLNGESDNDNKYTRFYATLGDAQAAAAGTVSHILGGRYITELAGTDLYVPAYLGGVGPAVAAANSGDVVHVDAGTFTTPEQVYVDKDLTLAGAGSGLTTIGIGFDTGSTADARGWFLVETGFDFDLSGVTLDGTGHPVYQGIRNKGEGSCTDVVFTEMKYPGYGGVAIAAFGTGPVDVTGCAFSEIGRVGVLYFGSVVNVSTFDGNTYTGKGIGDWLDYALDISAGANVTVTGNFISGCRGVASSDGSTSGAIMATTLYGAGTAATITGNVLTDNTTGILVGYDATDVSTVVAHYNSIYGNDTGVSSTAPVVDALDNWWGDPTGPLHPTLNPGGLGNEVSDNVLFDPYLTGLTQVTLVPAADLTNCPTNLTYTFHIEQPVVEEAIRGYNIQLQIDPAVMTTSVGAFTEGAYLDAAGDGQFFVVDNGGGVYTVSCAILGATAGASGAGDLFSVEFTPVAEGTSDIAVLSLLVRDLGNVPLSAGATGGSMQVDCTIPTMEPLAEAEGQYYNVAPVFSNFGFDDDFNLDFAEYQIDSDGWVALFTGIDATEWNNDGWTLAGFDALSEGTHTVYFRVGDDAGNQNGEGTPDTYSWQFYKDTVLPAPPEDFTALPGHDKVHLAWTNPTGDGSFVGIEIRRVGWSDYPEYGTGTLVIDAPAYPADETEGGLVTQTPLETYDDASMAYRDIYYYAAFSYDLAGNYSVFDVGAADRSTSYWLGDVDSTGFVNVSDLVTFSSTFGESDVDPGWDPFCDFGPTDDWSSFGIPLPDDMVDFEDLMIFSMIYGNVDDLGSPRPAAGIESTVESLEDLVTFRLVPATVGDEVVVSVVLDSGARSLKGFRLVVELAQGDRLTRVERGTMLRGVEDLFFDTVDAGENVVDISAAALGIRKNLSGSGEVAKIHLLPGSSATSSVKFSLIDIRDLDNTRYLLESDGDSDLPFVPNVTELMQNYPNPFNPMTTISFDMSKAGNVNVRIFDVSGRLVRTLADGHRDAGRYTVVWDGIDNNGSRVSSGVYFYSMTTTGYRSTRKMILLR